MTKQQQDTHNDVQFGLGNDILTSEDVSEDFDPESMLPPHKKTDAVSSGVMRSKFGVASLLEPPRKVKAKLEERRVEEGKLQDPLYEEFQNQPKTPEEFSEVSLYPLVVLRMKEENTVEPKKGEILFLGSLKNLSVLQEGRLFHVDVKLSSQLIFSLLPVLQEKPITLTEISFFVKGKPSKQEYSDYKLKSIVCKDFEETTTQCRLVFVRG